MQPYSFPLPPLSGVPAPLEALVPGEEVQSERGTFFRRRLELSVDDRYGESRLGDFLAIHPDAAAALARLPDLRDVPLERCLFLDTETTGLAGGTGTYAFMVGLGYFRTVAGDTRFVVDQCMMRSYGEERPMLDWLHEHLQRYAALITFNGRSFDVPLLQTRFLMSRIRVDFDAWLQFDLLHASRRLWRLALSSCSLQHIEQHILGVGREEDIESFLIPAIYYSYLRDGDGRYLQRVFNHNRADVLAMVGIATRACSMLGLGGAPERDPGASRLSAAEHLGLARIFEQMVSLDAAERAYRAALAGSLPVDLRCRALMGLATLLKRRRRSEEASIYWQAVVDESSLHSVPALVELSKYWEHQRRDAARAFDLASRARDRWLGGLPGGARPLPGLAWRQETRAAPDDFERRLDRLDRKRALSAP
jgi:uncharacterized protein YprB with RNaseH-like and TPR domain